MYEVNTRMNPNDQQTINGSTIITDAALDRCASEEKAVRHVKKFTKLVIMALPELNKHYESAGVCIGRVKIHTNGTAVAFYLNKVVPEHTKPQVCLLTLVRNVGCPYIMDSDHRGDSCLFCGYLDRNVVTPIFQPTLVAEPVEAKTCGFAYLDSFITPQGCIDDDAIGRAIEESKLKFALVVGKLAREFLQFVKRGEFTAVLDRALFDECLATGITVIDGNYREYLYKVFTVVYKFGLVADADARNFVKTTLLEAAALFIEVDHRDEEIPQSDSESGGIPDSIESH